MRRELPAQPRARNPRPDSTAGAGLCTNSAPGDVWFWQSKAGEQEFAPCLSLMGCFFGEAGVISALSWEGWSHQGSDQGRFPWPTWLWRWVRLTCELGEAPSAVFKHTRLDLEEETAL